jgi:large subunit ribosomal protein L9
MIVDAIKAKSGVEVARRQIDSQPLRMLGEYKVHIRLTVDLIPTIDVVVYREGEAYVAPVATKAAAPLVEESEMEPEPAADAEAETEPTAE